ncbi:hypothetical protein NX774_08155 [Massilia agilis]|uniref:Uncharacterized protein n=1 Tax=Massilia agilis TaxID=1811226 RepID=A0ABT2D9D7_9BURK|nr:hypothetical protein [Massilia agilis]MCS0807894.1 hypothetical protein [Massilia agilis]
MLTLFPGEPVLKKVRREAIERDVGIVKQLADELVSNISAEAAAMSSFWNRQSTIDERRKRVHVQVDSGKSRLTNAAILSNDALVRTGRLLARDAGLHRLYLEIDRGRICGVRHAMTDGAAVPAAA